MGKFRGTTALVTGASSGIGESFARQLAAQGTHLIIVARRKERLTALQYQLERRYGIRVTPIVMDLAQAGSSERLFEIVSEQKQTVDILINNAGSGKRTIFGKASLAEYQKMMQLNMITLTELTYLFGQKMIQQGDGYILQVASVAGFVPVPNFAVYAATKSYVLNFGRAIHKEFAGKHIHVTTLCPGATESEFFSKADFSVNRMLNTTKMNSEDVAKEGLAGLFKGRAVVVPGMVNKLMLSSLSCIPRKVQGALAEIAIR